MHDTWEHAATNSFMSLHLSNVPSACPSCTLKTHFLFLKEICKLSEKTTVKCMTLSASAAANNAAKCPFNPDTTVLIFHDKVYRLSSPPENVSMYDQLLLHLCLLLLLLLQHLHLLLPYRIHQLLLRRDSQQLCCSHGFVRLSDQPAPRPCEMNDSFLKPRNKRVQHVAKAVGRKCTVAEKVALHNKECGKCTVSVNGGVIMCNVNIQQTDNMEFRSTAENSQKLGIVPIRVSTFKAIQNQQHTVFVHTRQRDLAWESLDSALSCKHHT